MNCKWYQEELQFEASGSCSNRVTARDKKLRGEVPDRTCTACEIKPIIVAPLVLAVVLIPIYVAFKSVS